MKPSDRRLTPEWVLEVVRAVADGPIAFDPCTEADNPTQALQWTTAEQDAFSATWHLWLTDDLLQHDRDAHPGWHPVGWVNPPFSQMATWVSRLCIEATHGGTWVVFSGVDYSTAWWRQLDASSVARCELARRPKCVDPETGRTIDVTRSACLWLLTDSLVALRRFRAAGSRVGRVVLLDDGEVDHAAQ